VDLIAANVRTPERTLGDLFSGVAALRTAERRVMEIAEKYGADAFAASMGEILDQGERAARRALRALPKGVFSAEEWMDDDGLSEKPVPVRVSVTVTTDAFVADFTGSAPQVRGPINCTRTRLNSACRSIFKAVTEPGGHLNDGWFRPLAVVCPEGTVFTATRPSPVSTYWETGAYAVDLLWKALFPALPDRLTAGHFLSVCGTIVSGTADRSAGSPADAPGSRQGPFILVEPQAGGWGAGAGKDGESGLVAVGDGETYMMPVEVCESRYPLLVERYAFAVTDRGAGKFRGGFGLLKDYRLLCEEGFVTATFGRHRFLPWGAEGGDDGSPNGVAVLRGGETAAWKGKLARFPVKRGDVVRLVTGTGGGCGAPSERDPDLVRTDVMNGFCSLERAREVFGVELDPLSFEIDREKTHARRHHGNL
jgi:N-methylhydantoinase B